MKVLGYILIVLGILDVVTGFIGLSEAPAEYSTQMGGRIIWGIIFGVGGFFLIKKAKEKKKCKEDDAKRENT